MRMSIVGPITLGDISCEIFYGADHCTDCALRSSARYLLTYVSTQDSAKSHGALSLPRPLADTAHCAKPALLRRPDQIQQLRVGGHLDQLAAGAELHLVLGEAGAPVAP